MDSTTNQHALYKHADSIENADAVAWCFTAKDKFEQYPFTFPQLKSDEIKANVLYAGLCLSDSLSGRSCWGNANYPLAPGHEIIAEVSEVGADVQGFKKGDKVAFGTMRNICQSCKYCQKGREPLCSGLEASEKFTYGKYWGGYATQLQQPALLFFKLPQNLNLQKASPLLCAGITVYTPIKRYLEKGDKCAVIGIGGLGHLAVQFLAKKGHQVTGVTASDNKTELIKSLGATDVLNINDKEQLKEHLGKYDFVLNTAPVGSSILGEYVKLCAPAAKFIQVGVPHVAENMIISFMPVVMKEVKIIGSLVGNREDIREMLELCAKEDIYPMVEEFSFEEFDKALDRLENGRPTFRCVVNVQEYSEKNGLFK